jgi:nucleoside-diphosphate-sugar epimerase
MSSTSSVLVTGASGYVASWIVQKLLEKGYTVHGTVRNPDQDHKVRHLREMERELPGTLKLFKADLLEEGAFHEAAQGCNAILHTASPFLAFDVKDPQRQLIDPALQGTRNVLAAANSVASIEKVVLTSSVAAIYGDNKDIEGTEKGIFSEAHWNTSSSLRHQPYPLSKTVAEKAAWEMAEAQNRWKMATINPGFVLGPSLSKRSDGVSVSFVQSLLNGEYSSGFAPLYFGYVDVRDVAEAHIQAMERQEAEGRHILVSDTWTPEKLVNFLSTHYRDRYKVPQRIFPKAVMYIAGPIIAGMSWKFVSRNIGVPIRFDNSRSQQQLGINYRPLESTFHDHIQQLSADGMV